MEETYFKNVMTATIFAVLLILSFFLIKPILLAIVSGMILAFIFTPLYKWLHKVTHGENLSATIICILLILIILLPLWFLTPIMINQSIKLYLSSQTMDLITPLKTIFPSFFTSETFSAEVGNVLSKFITNLSDSLINFAAGLIWNFPTIMLQLLVMFFTLFFVLRDRDQLVSFIQSLLPFSKEVQKKLFESSTGITSAVLYGQIVIGLIQGVIMGIGFFLFNVPNSLVLTLLASLAGVLPIIGTMIVWFPVLIYLFANGNNFAGFGILIFGLISSNIDNFLRPLFVSKRVKIPSSIILIGMIGGIFFFGVLGLILGPLILSYLLIILETYQKRKKSEFFVEQEEGNSFLLSKN